MLHNLQAQFAKVAGVFAFFVLLTILPAAFGQTESGIQSAFRTGSDFYRAGDCMRAIPALKAAVSGNPLANLPLGKCYIATQAYEEAVNSLTALIRLVPSDSQARKLLATAFERSGRAPDALNLVRDYAGRNPEDLEAQLDLGRLYIDTGDKEKASAIFSLVLTKSPDDPAALLGSGLVASADSRWSEAIASLNRASQLAPGSPAVYKALGAAYAAQGKCEEALVPFNRAFDLMPSDFPTAKGLAKCYLTLGKLDDVSRVLRSSTLEEAKDTEATGMMATALNANPQALDEYARGVIELNPDNTVARRLRAQSLMKSRQIDAAKAEYQEILKLEKDHPDCVIAFNLAEIYRNESDGQNAHRFYQLAASSPCATPAMHLALARSYLTYNDASSAQAELSKAGPSEGETADGKVIQLEIYLKSSNWEAANKLSTELLAQDPNGPKVLDLSAQIALKQQKYEDDAGFLERLYQITPADKEIRNRLARLYVNHSELKKDDRVTDLLKDLVARQEADPEGYLVLAYFYQRNKDATNAKAYYDLGFTRMQNPVPAKFAWAYLNYANFLFGQGNFDDALASQLHAAQLNPNDEVTEFNLGLIYLKLGKTEEVEQVIEKLQGINSDSAAKLEEQLRRTPHKAKSGAA